MTENRRLTRGSAVTYVVVIGAWTVPWAAYSVAQFDPWLAPWLFNPFAPFTFFLPLVYAADWLCGSLLLLLMGLDAALTGRGRRWRIAWSLTVAAGAAFEFAALWHGPLLKVTPYDAAHKSWYLLVDAAGFVLLAVVMAAAALAGSPRAGLAAARAAVLTAASRATRKPVEHRDGEGYRHHDGPGSGGRRAGP